MNTQESAGPRGREGSPARRVGWAIVALLALAVGVAVGCRGESQGKGVLPYAPTQEVFSVQDLARESPEVQEAYQFAIDRPDILAYVPCYCGCDKMGHTSNLACFIQGRDSTGTVHLEGHGST